MIRRTVFYSGCVQGVGFRYTAWRIAASHQVAGYVRNLPDGRVQAVIEGDPDQVERFTRAVAEDMAENIRGVESHDSAATREFSRFEIRF